MFIKTGSEGSIRQWSVYMTARIGQEKEFPSSGLRSYYLIIMMMMIPLLGGGDVTELRLASIGANCSRREYGR